MNLLILLKLLRKFLNQEEGKKQGVPRSIKFFILSRKYRAEKIQRRESGETPSAFRTARRLPLALFQKGSKKIEKIKNKMKFDIFHFYSTNQLYYFKTKNIFLTSRSDVMSIHIKNISKSYRDKKALQNCTLTLNTGIYALLGPNGAGKSTLMNILAGNLLPDSGEILYQDGQAPAQNILKMGKNYRSKLGFMPQYPGMYPNFTVEYFMKYMY